MGRSSTLVHGRPTLGFHSRPTSVLLLLTERSGLVAHEYCSQCYFMNISIYYTDHIGGSSRFSPQNSLTKRVHRAKTPFCFFPAIYSTSQRAESRFCSHGQFKRCSWPHLGTNHTIDWSFIHSFIHSFIDSSAIARTGGFETIGSISFYLPTSRLYCLPPPAHNNTTKHFLSFTTSSAS